MNYIQLPKPKNYRNDLIKKIKEKSDPSFNQFQTLRTLYFTIKPFLEKNLPIPEYYYQKNDLENYYGALFFALSNLPNDTIEVSTIIASIKDQDVFYYFIKTMLNNKTESIKNCPFKDLLCKIVLKEDYKNI